jgi:hypothetical protein
MVPLEISVETFSTGSFDALREETISENKFLPGHSSSSISFTMHNEKTKTKLMYLTRNTYTKTLSHNTETTK